MNRVDIIGHLGQDPEIKSLDSGKVVANFSVATNESYKVGNEKKEVTDWHRVVVWNQPAEFLQEYAKKGDLIRICGKLKTRSWDQDGVTKYATEIVVSGFGCEVKLMNSKKHAEGVSEAVQEAVIDEGQGSVDDLPF